MSSITYIVSTNWFDWTEDGFDECLVPANYKGSGFIKDDDLFTALVGPMARGVTVTCLMDCCHSGTVLDLPYQFKANGVELPENITLRGAALSNRACVATQMDEQSRYIIMLKRLSIDGLSEKDTFQLDEKSAASSAAFEASPENLNKAVNLCNVHEREIRRPEETNNTMSLPACPKRTADEETCVSDVTSTATSTLCGSLFMFITVLLLGLLQWQTYHY